VSLELGEATVVADGGLFAFQVPSKNLVIGQRILFVREGDEFVVI